MKVMAIILIVIILTGCQADSEKHIIRFAGEDWLFPSTIGQVVQTHKLSFRPPAYYYKNKGDSLILILSYDWKTGDFDNDRQEKKVLFPRDIKTYTFQIKRNKNTYDSLKHLIEKSYNKQFHLIKGTKTDSWTIAEKNRPFQHDLLQVDNCLTIGIKNSYSGELGDIITVHFMYGLSLGDIGIQVGND
jgi:hypothetical protein